MNYWERSSPPGNLFNVFSRGKTYFLIRLGVEGLLLLALVVGCFILTKASLDVYPTVVRTSDARVYLGEGRAYRQTPDEVYAFAQDILEATYTRDERGPPIEYLRPFVAQEILSDINRFRPTRTQAGFLQTSSLTGFVVSSANHQGVAGYAEISITQMSGTSVMAETIYLNVAFLRVPISRSNPYGLVLVGRRAIDAASYNEARGRVLGEAAGRNPQQQLLPFDL